MAKENPREWTQADVAALRDYLLRNPKFLQELRRSMPRRREACATRDESANHGERMEGWLGALDRIEAMMLDLAQPPPQGAGYVDTSQDRTGL